MKIRHTALSIICFFLVTLVGCNLNQDQNEQARGNYGDLGVRNDQTIDTYRLNEKEQLMNRGQNGGDIKSFGTISNANTDIPSDQYPHTKAVQIQQAQYKFVFEGGVNDDGEPARHQPAAQEQDEVTPDQEQNNKQQSPAPVKQSQDEQQQEQQAQQGAKGTEGTSEAAQQVIELTNAERRKNGLSDLQADSQLSNVAKVKSDDMQQNNYFSHTSPTHGSPFDMIRDHDVSYSAAGENIAQGQNTPEKVVESWMNSEGHRKNIMSDNFTHIGVGYNEQGHYWTQMFISK